MANRKPPTTRGSTARSVTGPRSTADDPIVLSDTEDDRGVGPSRRGPSLASRKRPHPDAASTFKCGLDHEALFKRIVSVSNERDDLFAYTTQLELSHAQAHETIQRLHSDSQKQATLLGSLQADVARLQQELHEAKASPASVTTQTTVAAAPPADDADLMAFIQSLDEPPLDPTVPPFDWDAFMAATNTPAAATGAPAESSSSLMAIDIPGPVASTSTSNLGPPTVGLAAEDYARRESQLREIVNSMQAERVGLLKVWDELKVSDAARSELSERVVRAERESATARAECEAKAVEGDQLRARIDGLEKEKQDALRIIAEGQRVVEELRRLHGRESLRADNAEADLRVERRRLQEVMSARTPTTLGRGREGSTVSNASGGAGTPEDLERQQRARQAEQQIQRLRAAQAEAERAAKEAEAKRRQVEMEVQAMMAVGPS